MLSRKLDEVLAVVEGFTEKAGLGVAVDLTEKTAMHWSKVLACLSMILQNQVRLYHCDSCRCSRRYVKSD